MSTPSAMWLFLLLNSKHKVTPLSSSTSEIQSRTWIANPFTHGRSLRQSFERWKEWLFAVLWFTRITYCIANDERTKGWPASADDVYVCHGVTKHCKSSSRRRWMKVASPRSGPHYPPYMAYPQMYGAETIEYRLNSDDGWSLDFDDIESKMNDDVRLFV